MRTLIVDDDYFSRLKLKMLLTTYGDCDAVPNAELAMGMYAMAIKEGVPYSLVTMDINLGNDTNGIEAIKRIRAFDDENKTYSQNEEAKIMIITGVANLESQLQAFRNHCDGFLEKPVNTEKIREKLEELGLTG